MRRTYGLLLPRTSMPSVLEGGSVTAAHDWQSSQRTDQRHARKVFIRGGKLRISFLFPSLLSLESSSIVRQLIRDLRIMFMAVTLF
jgi:hypothetical protein